MNAPPSRELVLDTDILSFHLNRDGVRVPRYAPHLAGATLHISFVTAAEMRFGALLRGWGPRRQDELEQFLARHVVIESHPEIGRIWARIRVETQRLGRPIERQDAWIAATAYFLRVPLVTHNASDFRHIPDLQIITEPDPRP